MLIRTAFSSFVPPNSGGKQLLDYLEERFSYHTRQEWEERIGDGRVTVDGERVSSDFRLKNGMKLTSQVEHEEPPVPEEVEVIHIGGEIGIFGKSAEVPVSRTGQIIYNTFVQQVRRKIDNPEVRLLHRLDRETSGLILCALSGEAVRKHQKNLDGILLRKFYLAVVRGVPEWETFDADFPLREAVDHPARARMEVRPDGKPSRTLFRKIDSSDRNGGVALILAELISGRKHQIRAHLAHLGHPVIGDKLYTGEGEAYIKMATGRLADDDLAPLGAPHHLLHSWGAWVHLPESPEPELFFSELFPLPFRKFFPPDSPSLSDCRKRFISPLFGTSSPLF